MPNPKEKLGFRSVSSHFWNQHQESPASLNCVVYDLPGQPGPLSQRQTSGLNRSQQLLLAQKLADVPFVPSYASSAGGLVLDRVLACVGTHTWWMGVTTRLKAQRLWQQHKRRERGNVHIGKRLIDASNYALGIFARAKPTRSTSFVYTGEVGSVEDLLSGESMKVDSKRPHRSSWTFRQGLPGHELCAKILENERFMDRDSSYIDIPRVASMHVSSKPKPRGFQYAMGIHKISAPCDLEERGTEDTPTGHSLSVLRHSTHAQIVLSYDRHGRVWIPAGFRKDSETDMQHDKETKGTTNEGFFEESAAEQWTSVGSKSSAKTRRKNMPYSGIAPKQGLTLSGMIGTIARLPSTAMLGNSDLVFGEKVRKVLRQVSTRGVCSLGAAFQLGHYKRTMLDFTSFQMRLDMSSSASQRAGRFLHSVSPGSSAPSDQGSLGPLSHHPAFSLENMRSNRVLTLSFCQQLYGPMRFCVDARCGLKCSRTVKKTGPRTAASQSQVVGQSIGHTVANLRPLDVRDGLKQLVGLQPDVQELLYGVDFPIPSAHGTIRFAAWYSPYRKEALAELRLLDI